MSHVTFHDRRCGNVLGLTAGTIAARLFRNRSPPVRASRQVHAKQTRNRSPASPDGSTFLKVHLEGSVGIDFFDIPTATFDVLHGFLVIDHRRRKLLHVGVTDHPSAEWTANQFVAALPGDATPNRLFRDRDFIFGSTFTARVRAIGIEQHISAPRSPWQNPFADRAE